MRGGWLGDFVVKAERVGNDGYAGVGVLIWE